ncbi:MAG: BTAD domain-containing putative transcriptional regulator [Actinomycetota bacterium]
MRRFAATLALIGLLLGTPMILALLFGPPTLPHPNLGEFLESLSGQLLSADSVFRMLGLLAWLLWAYIAVLTLLRIIALKILTPRSKAGPALSSVTGRLTPSFVLRIIDIALGGALLLTPLVIPVSATAAFGSQTSLVDTNTEQRAVVGHSRSCLVRPGDSLWKIAERELGSGEQSREIFELNKGRHFPDGRTLTEPRLIHPNWLLWLPDPLEAVSEEVGNALIQPGDSPVDRADAQQSAEPTPPPPAATQSAPTNDDGSLDTEESGSAVVQLPTGSALAASFVAGIIASQAIATLRRRRRFQPDSPIEQLQPEPSVVIEGRRAGLADGSKLDNALAALRSAWPTDSSGWPPVIACIEGSDSATFLLKKTDASPRPRSTSAVSFEDDETFQAKVQWTRSPSGEPLSALEQGLFVPIGRCSANESVSYRLMGNPPLSVRGRLTNEFMSNLLLACAAGRSVHEVELIVLGTDLQLGPVASLPHLRQIPWEHAPEAVAELQAEALGRARVFAQHGASDLSDFLSAGSPEYLPALVVATTPPPRRLQDSIEALASNPAASGIGFVAAGWRPSTARVALEADSQITIETDLALPDRLDSLLLSESDTQQVVEILKAASSDLREPTIPIEESPVEVHPFTDGEPEHLNRPVPRVDPDGHNDSGEIGSSEASSPSDAPLQVAEECRTAVLQNLNGHSPEQPTPEPLPIAVDESTSSTVSSSDEGVGLNRLEVRCLGAMSISRRDATLHTGWVKGSKELLAYLIVNRDGVSKDRILEVMWPGANLKEGERLLREALYHLRKQTLGREDAKWSDDYVRRVGETLVLGEDDRWWADVWEFESLASTAGRLEHEESKAALRRALSLYGGEFCDDCYFSWAEQLRERYRRLYLRSCTKLAEILEAEGEIDEAIEVLERGIQVDRFCEDLYRRLIRLEASQGRTNAATRLFQQLSKLLDQELDLEPEPTTLDLMNQIRSASHAGVAGSERSSTH